MKISDAQFNNYIISWRRKFHSEPELSFREFKTSQKVAAELKKLGLAVKTRVGGTGVVGLLQGGRQGRTVALRADMDALPIDELTNHKYKSVHKGIMHACGHDGHMAMLLGAAKLLSANRSEICGNIKFIFQPAEETPPGGALGMIREGVLENPKVDAIFACHLDSSLPSGKVGLRKGAMMAASDNFEISIFGKGGHAARPHNCLDPVVTAAQVIMGLQNIISRKVDPAKPAVITVGKMEAGTKHNIIPEEALLIGTARTIDRYSTKMMPIWIRRMAEGIAAANGLKAKVKYERGYPVLYNNSKLIDFAEKSIMAVYGKKAIVYLDEPMMGGEDMAYFLQKTPGAFLRLGSYSNSETSYPWHHPKFNIDEKVLPIGAKMLSSLVIKFLNRNQINGGIKSV